jgi:hypothetical protein
MSITAVTKELHDNWMIESKKETDPETKRVLLEVYKTELDMVKSGARVDAIVAVINNSNLSSSQKSALILALQRSTGGKVAMATVHGLAGAAGGVAVGAVGELVVTAIAAGSAGGASLGPVGIVVGAFGGLAVGLGVAATKL